MKVQRFYIDYIPALLWGEPSDNLYIHVHGKMSCKEYAEGFAEIAARKGFQTLSFDLPEHGDRKGSRERCDIWNGMRDLTLVADYAFPKWKNLSLFACSVGAYFSLNTYADRGFQKCLFQSPIVEMEYLVGRMLEWFNVTEERLREEREIPNSIDPLRWDYYQYIKAHPIQKWDIPTAILYGGKDAMQSQEVMQRFAKAHNCKLTISPNSEHPFMDRDDLLILQRWLEENI